MNEEQKTTLRSFFLWSVLWLAAVVCSLLFVMYLESHQIQITAFFGGSEDAYYSFVEFLNIILSGALLISGIYLFVPPTILLYAFIASKSSFGRKILKAHAHSNKSMKRRDKKS